MSFFHGVYNATVTHNVYKLHYSSGWEKREGYKSRSILSMHRFLPDRLSGNPKES